MSILTGIFKLPILRHTIAAVLIVGGMYFFALKPLEEQNKYLKARIDKMSDNQQEIVKELTSKRTFHVENTVSFNDMQPGSTIQLFPETTLDLSTTELAPMEPVDTIKVKKNKKKKSLFKKIQGWFK